VSAARFLPWIALALALPACGGDDGPGSGDSGDDDTADDGADAPDAAPAVPCESAAEHAGEGTYYDADGSGNCSFDPSPDDLRVAAMNQTDYDDSAACGACAAIDGPGGSITVRIVDRCPECAPGDVDLSAEAFAMIADPHAGRVEITWRYVPCEVSGPVRYRFKEGSNPFWTAIQVRNHRHAIASLEARPAGGEWRTLPRESYNYFVAESGLGGDPIDLRVTDVLGEAIEDVGVPPGDAIEVAGSSQLPTCD
jgi:expansin (peptidoglycan-binding protein)